MNTRGMILPGWQRSSMTVALQRPAQFDSCRFPLYKSREGDTVEKAKNRRQGCRRMMLHCSRACWNFVIDFGDIAVLAPATCAICAVLWLHRHKQEAFVWGISFAGCAAMTMLLKTIVGQIEFDLFGRHFHADSLPSGHTAMSVAFYGGLAAFLRAALPGWAGGVSAALLMVLTGLISISTIVLYWHTGTDVAAGLLLGGVFAAFIARTAWRRPNRPREGAAVAAIAALVIAVLHGIRLDVNIETLQQVAGGGNPIHTSASVCKRFMPADEVGSPEKAWQVTIMDAGNEARGLRRLSRPR